MRNGRGARVMLLGGGALAAIAISSTAPHATPGAPAGEAGPLAARCAPPPGFARVAVTPGSFGEWLRALPVRAGRPPVRLHDGSRKRNQSAHHAVLDLDVGSRDLQQCADVAIRLRADYLREAGREEDLCFRFTSGDPVPWTRWRAGERPSVGRSVRWVAHAADDSEESYRRWLDVVFTYAGTLSLSRDLPRVALEELRPGDVFVQGGSPGHAVVVLDVAEALDGRRVMLLGQGFMPAQDIHVLRNAEDPDTPWVPVTGEGRLVTPEWTFEWTDLRRFPSNACDP